MPKAKLPKRTKAVHQLHKRRYAAKHKLATHHPRAHKKLAALKFNLADLRRHSARVLSTAALTGGLLLGSPVIEHAMNPVPVYEELPLAEEQMENALKRDLAKILPEKVGPLPDETEKQASEIIEKNLGIKAVAELDGVHLNQSYGLIGAEQHLPRFPGDTVEQHDAIQKSGITPGRGAFGYFAPSRAELTQEDIMQEKYYVAVQTLYLPQWNSQNRWLKPWFDKRQVLVVNPVNGKSVVAVVGDAGPAAWTGKHFGGSPEIMAHLELNRGKQKGRVLIFFLDENGKKIALGPVYQNQKEETFLAEK